MREIIKTPNLKTKLAIIKQKNSAKIKVGINLIKSIIQFILKKTIIIQAIKNL